MNLTDLNTRRMRKNRREGYRQSYHAQGVVEAAAQNTSELSARQSSNAQGVVEAEGSQLIVGAAGQRQC